MSEHVKATTDTDFETDVLGTNGMVLVDFWAEWCQPCKSFIPVLDDVASEYSDKIKVFKVNVDQNTETPAKFGVRGIPTLLIFKDGDLLATKVGAMNKAQLKAFIDENS